MADTNSSAPTPSNGASGPTLGQRIAGFFRPSASGAPRKEPSSTSRLLTGTVVFILIAEVLLYLIQLADIKLNLHLNQPIFGPQAGWLTWLQVIILLVIVAVWVVLRRMGILPRDMFSARASTTTRSSAKAGKSSGGGSNANQIPGIGKVRTRAERRHTTAVKATTAANGKNGKNAASSGATQETFSAEHDEVYDRVRAAQRLRKRRAAR